jgi:DNA polymerase-3 subunit alpha
MGAANAPSNHMTSPANSWACLDAHSHYSFLNGISQPVKMAERAAQTGLSAMAITDYGSLAGTVQFIKALDAVCECGHHKTSHGKGYCHGNQKKCSCTSFQKKIIKPILGIELYIKSENEFGVDSELIVLAKNLKGWKKLIAITSEANTQENFYYKPRISFDRLAQYCDGSLIGLSGHIGSRLSQSLFKNELSAYTQQSVEEARSLVSNSTVQDTVKLAEKLSGVFGKDNFFLEIQRFDDKSPAIQLLAEGMRYISKKAGIPCLASCNPHYTDPEDYDDQRLVLCSDMDVSFEDSHRKIFTPEYVSKSKFFKSQKYYVPTLQEISAVNSEEEVRNTLNVADMCEVYDVLGPPNIPIFPTPDGVSPAKYLQHLCAQGWRSRVENKVPTADLPNYKSRIKYELSVIEEAGLPSYFLIVQDYCEDARRCGEMVGPGRGSAAGSLISYLIGITDVDPLPDDLMFERFWNPGRSTKDRVRLPDIDCDFQVTTRKNRLSYLRSKYGRDRVAQMITFSRYQGRAAIKEVFRIKYPGIPIAEVNALSANIPDKAEIADELQKMQELGEDPAILMWALENNAKELKDYCYIDDQGRLQGEYATAFRQAIRLEGIKHGSSKHASGVVISNSPLADLVPMVYDKSSSEPIAGMEMGDLEEMGIPKFDILGLATLDKLAGVRSLLLTGRIE